MGDESCDDGGEQTSLTQKKKGLMRLEARKGRECAYKYQRCVHVFAIFFEHGTVMFVGNGFVDSPKVRRGIDIGRGGV